MKAFFQKQAQLVVVNTLEDLCAVTQARRGRVLLLAVDLRGESNFGADKLRSVAIQTLLKLLPLTAVCSRSHLDEYLAAMKYGAEILDVPVEPDAFVRRCNRVCRAQK